LFVCWFYQQQQETTTTTNPNISTCASALRPVHLFLKFSSPQFVRAFPQAHARLRTARIHRACVRTDSEFFFFLLFVDCLSLPLGPRHPVPSSLLPSLPLPLSLFLFHCDGFFLVLVFCLPEEACWADLVRLPPATIFPSSSPIASLTQFLS